MPNTNIHSIETAWNVDGWIVRWRRSDEPGVRYHFHLGLDRKTPLKAYVCRFHFQDDGRCISQTYPARSAYAADLAAVAQLITFERAAA